MEMLSGKTAIIAGASSGMGAATAQLFAAQGATVVLGARSAGALEKLAGEINAAGGKALAVPTDATDRDGRTGACGRGGGQLWQG